MITEIIMNNFNTLPPAKNYLTLNKAFLLAIALFLAMPAHAAVVKKSKSEICHDTSSSYYKRTKNYTKYDSMESCLKSGGRKPKR